MPPYPTSCCFAATLLAATSAAADPAASSSSPSADANLLRVTPFLYAIDGYLTSTHAVLYGIDVAYQRRLGAHFGVMARGGTVVFGVDEITGNALHLEAGGVGRVALLPDVDLEAALLAGYHFGGLDHKSDYRDRAGPTIAGELMLAVALSRNASLVIGGGYRFAATGYSTGKVDHDKSYAGHTMRIGGGVRF